MSCFACAVSSAPWLLFTRVPAGCVVLLVRCPGPPGPCSLVCPLGVLCCVYGVRGPLTPVQRCARSVCCVACVGSGASGLLFTDVPARCVVSRCVCSLLGQPAPVHRCACSVLLLACAVSLATWLLITGVPAPCVVLRVRCPGQLGSRSPVRPLGALLCLCSVLRPVAPDHRCACWECCVACAVSRATWLLFTGVPARCVVLRVPCPGPLASCSPLCPLAVLCFVCGVLGHLAPVHRSARSVCFAACTVSCATSLLFTEVPARCVVLRVRCPGPLGSCSAVCPLGVLCCVCGVLGHLAPVHQRAGSVCCVACTVSGAPGSCSPVCSPAGLCCVCSVRGHLAPIHRCARSVCCVVLRVRCPGTLGSCSPVCSLGVLRWVCGVLGQLAPVHRWARSVCCVVGCVCGVSLRGAHLSIWTAAVS